MVTIEEVVNDIENITNEELSRYIRDDILASQNFGLDLDQARFLMEVSIRLADCPQARPSKDDAPPFLATRGNGHPRSD